MTWRTKVNGGLRRLTGYEVRRTVPTWRTDKSPKKRAAKPASAAQAGPKAKGWPEMKLPVDYDEQAKATIRAVKPWTMTSPAKLYALILAVRHVSAHQIPGAIVETGVWRGGSIQAAARTLIETGDTARELYMFDTFKGMPPPTERDRRHDGAMAADLLAQSSKDSAIWSVATIAEVQQGLRQIPYPDEKLRYVQGLVEETTPEQAPEQISILRLDTCWYESSKHELEHLYPRLVSGGVLIIDDYGWWHGARDAVDEWLEKTGDRLLLLPMAEGRIAVKP